MTNPLRDRIAAVIARMNDCWETDDHHLMVADAVIAALGTRRCEVQPHQDVRCDHCEWVGQTHDFPPHLLTCVCVNLSHPLGSH